MRSSHSSPCARSSSSRVDVVAPTLKNHPIVRGRVILLRQLFRRARPSRASQPQLGGALENSNSIRVSLIRPCCFVTRTSTGSLCIQCACSLEPRHRSTSVKYLARTWSASTRRGDLSVADRGAYRHSATATGERRRAPHVVCVWTGRRSDGSSTSNDDRVASARRRWASRRRRRREDKKRYPARQLS